MPKTAVINPRRRRRRSNPRRRRRNAINLYGSATNPRRRRRRRNPEQPGKQVIRKTYASRGYRAKNPGLDFDQAIDIMPAATVGALVGRWAVKIAGEMKDDKPGIAHAIALYLAAVFGSDLIGSLLGSAQKASYAQIGTLAFGGDLFTRTLLLGDNDWAKENLYLGQGEDEYDETGDAEDLDFSGFTDQSALGADQEFIDEQGRRWMQTAAGWTLLSGEQLPQVDPASYSGFFEESQLGRRSASRKSSFGYGAGGYDE